MGGSRAGILATPSGRPARSGIRKLHGLFALVLAGAASVFFLGNSVRTAAEEYGMASWPINRRVEYILRSAPLIGGFRS